MASDRLDAGRRNAPAVRAIGVAAELARRDAALQIRRIALGRLRENTFLRRARRLGKHVQHAVQHLQLGKARAQSAQVGDDPCAVVLGEPFGRQLAHLRCVETDPEQAGVSVLLPEVEKFFEISFTARLLAVTVQCTVIWCPLMCFRIRS